MRIGETLNTDQDEAMNAHAPLANSLRHVARMQLSEIPTKQRYGLRSLLMAK